MPFRFLVLSALVSLTVVSISVPARAATGSTADVRVADAPAARAQAVSGSAPVLQQPTPMSLPFGTTADQTLHATDADGDSLSFSLGFGPSYVTVTTTGPGGGAATGNVHLAPSPGDVGSATASILVSDGFLQDARTLSITVTGPNAAPVLTQPGPMNSREGQFLNQALHATDSDGNSLSFFKVSGPEYLTVLTEDPGTGTAEGVATISPPAFSAGTTSGTIGVTDGALSDQKTFSITVTPNAAPTLDFISDVFVQARFVTDRSPWCPVRPS